MKSLFITDLEVGAELTNELFLLQEVVSRQTKDGRPYLLCTVRDRTGQCGAVFWNVPDYVREWVRTGEPVLVTGHVVMYKDNLQINITDMNQEPHPNLSDLLPASARPRPEMLAELREQIDQLAQPWQGLATNVLLDEDFLEMFANAPAARSMHHAYIGGLLEHTLSMVKIARYLAQHYPHVNEDLLVTGALLHDMGKVLEYTVEGGFNVSEDGRLVGHIIRAIILVEQAALPLDFPADKLQQLTHLIAAHHGTLEWGSPTQPKTLEAILLHQIDLLDSRIQGFFDHINNDGGERWTNKPSAMFSTELRRPDSMPL